MSKNILIVASHPDDEILGCSGTVKKLINDGFEVVTIITTKGRKEVEDSMQSNILNANKQLGVNEVIFLQYPNLELETIPLHEITKEIEGLIDQYNPEIIFTHHYGDLNRDHQITYQAVLTAARPLPGKKPIELICFETVSSSEWNHHTNDKTFKPNYFVDITNTINNKIEALKAYDIEMRPYPHPRSYEGIEYLARVRGMTIGVNYAEAFEIIRRVWK
jgi:LmbE family N-acetylglucosaminyl deacetylase